MYLCLMFTEYQLGSGLRILLMPSATDVVYAGIAVATGTRHELDSESGMAHLVEHMSFKGTQKLTSKQVINRIEGVGGELNAFTGKEDTVYYSAFLKQHLKLAVPLLLDIVFSSTYPNEELQKEIEVVIDEIESYNDSPAELIFDDFEGLLFPSHPLGRKILGEAERLRAYKSEDVRRFVDRCYHPSRAVLFVKGNVRLEQVLRTVPERWQRPMESAGGDINTLSACQVESVKGETIQEKPIHQTHVVLGARAFAATDPRHYGVYLLNNLLGGPAMNSRLSMALRERAGLVYTVESNLFAYTDTGVWSVYFGCDVHDLRRCLRLVHQEMRKLVDAPLSNRSLAAAKRQLIGQLGVGYDHFENVAIGSAKHFLHARHALTQQEIFQSIEELTAVQLQEIAAEVFDINRLTTLIYLPNGK